MPITNLPTFVHKQLLTAAQLNQIVTALQTKFAGNISGSDLVWPLVTDGDIDFGGTNTLLNLPTLWDVVNADEYDTFTDAVAALPTAGGSIYIPSGSSVVTDGINVTGKNICIFGDGDSSILDLTSSASSGYLIKHSGGGQYRFQMYNLMVDGNTTGSAQDGIRLAQVFSAKFHNVTFKNFTGRAIWITNSGAAGNYSDNVQVSNCLFEGGTLAQVEANDVIMLQIMGCQFSGGSAEHVKINPSTSSHWAKQIKIVDNCMKSGTTAVDIIGNGVALNNMYGFIDVSGNIIESPSAAGISLGSTSHMLTKVRCVGNIIDAPGTIGISANVNYGQIKDNTVYTAGSYGIDLGRSKYASTTGNLCRTSGTYGCNLSTCTGCIITGNDFSLSSSGIFNNRDTCTSPVIYNNVGDQGMNTVALSWNVGYSGGTGNWAGISASTIPANSHRAVYDTILITAQIGYSGGAGTATVELVLEGNSVGTASIANTEEGVASWLVFRDVAGNADTYTTSPNAAGDSVNGTVLDWEQDIAIAFNMTVGTGGTIVVGGAQAQFVTTSVAPAVI